MFQNYAIFTHMTVYENLAFGLKCSSSAPGSQAEIDSRGQGGSPRSSASPRRSTGGPARLSVNDMQKVALGR